MTGVLLVWMLAPFAAKTFSLALMANNYLAQSAYKVFQLGGPVWWRRNVDGRRGWGSLWPTEEPWPSAATWAWGVAIGIGAVVVAAVSIPPLATLLGIDPATLRADIDKRFAITPGRAVLVVIFLTALNSALEELHFRAWLDPELSRRFGRTWGVVGSATAFAAMHLFIFARMAGVTLAAMALMFAALFVLAACWSLLARRPGGIHAAGLSHSLADAGLLTWGLFWLGYF